MKNVGTNADVAGWKPGWKPAPPGLNKLGESF
jgi:hypothetical protein